MCRKHKTHEWEDCELNPKNRNKNKSETCLVKSEEIHENREKSERKNRPKHRSKGSKKEEKHHISRRSGRSHRSHHHRRRYYSEDSDSSRTTSDSSYSLYEMFGSFETMNIEEAYLTDSDSEGSQKSDAEPTMSSELLISIPASHGKRVFTALLDSGCSKSLANQDILRQAKGVKMSGKRLTWQTKAGEFKTIGKGELREFCLPQFTMNRRLNHVFHAFKKTKHDRYDFIFGQRFLPEDWT